MSKVFLQIFLAVLWKVDCTVEQGWSKAAKKKFRS